MNEKFVHRFLLPALAIAFLGSAIVGVTAFLLAAMALALAAAETFEFLMRTTIGAVFVFLLTICLIIVLVPDPTEP